MRGIVNRRPFQSGPEEHYIAFFSKHVTGRDKQSVAFQVNVCLLESSAETEFSRKAYRYGNNIRATLSSMRLRALEIGLYSYRISPSRRRKNTCSHAGGSCCVRRKSSTLHDLRRSYWLWDLRKIVFLCNCSSKHGGSLQEVFAYDTKEAKRGVLAYFPTLPSGITNPNKRKPYLKP